MAPLVWNPWFWSIQALPILALAIAWGAARRQERFARDPDFARRVSANRAVRVHLTAMDDALKRGDPSAFFHAARKTLQERLGQRWKIKPETITLSEVEDRLRHDPSLPGDVQKVFKTADAVSYSGQVFSSETLHEWKRVILGALKTMEGKP